MRLLGRVSHDDLPALYGCADVFAMLCRNRWAGLEQEGFGIVFLEAAPAGCRRWPATAAARPRRWCTARPVWWSPTGDRVPSPTALRRLLDDADLRVRMGVAGRERAVADYAYDVLATRLGAALATWEAAARG